MLLIAGLVIFLGVHSLDLFATQKRHELIEQKGEGTYKGLYTLLSLIGFALIIWGYGVSRSQGIFLWLPSAGMRHITVVLSLVAFVLLAATYFKGSWIKIRLGHPMALAVKVWAFGHLLSNGRLGDVLLFGSFLIWAIVYYAIKRRRDRLAGTGPTTAVSLPQTAIGILAGFVAWLVFAIWLHRWLIGVSPFGV